MSPLGRALLDDLDAEDLDVLADRLAPRIADRLIAPKAEASVLLSCAEAAAQAGVCTETVRRAVRSGVLPARRVGRSPRITPDDLDAWLSRGARERRSPAPRPRRRSVGKRPLAEALASTQKIDYLQAKDLVFGRPTRYNPGIMFSTKKRNHG